jgi:Recombination endonuclease VII
MDDVPYDRSPACWSWPPPVDSDGESPRKAMDNWQAGRCATCGHVRHLVEDHDHETGLVRGWLCRRCNTAEGLNPYSGRLWREYRERNPASICGVSERYWNPLTRQFAEPAPQLDIWANNPMRGVL